MATVMLIYCPAAWFLENLGLETEVQFGGCMCQRIIIIIVICIYTPADFGRFLDYRN